MPAVVRPVTVAGLRTPASPAPAAGSGAAVLGEPEQCLLLRLPLMGGHVLSDHADAGTGHVITLTWR